MALVEARGLHLRYPGQRREHLWTLEDPELDIDSGAAVWVVGESGSGKSTLVRTCCTVSASSGRDSV